MPVSDNEGYTLASNGASVFEFGGITRTLKRPTLKEYRTFVEILGTLRDQVQIDPEDPTSVAALKGNQLTDQMDSLLDWWDTVFTTLAGEGIPKDAEGKVDQDVVPTWMLSATLLPELVQHWQSVPSRRGGQ